MHFRDFMGGRLLLVVWRLTVNQFIRNIVGSIPTPPILTKVMHCRGMRGVRIPPEIG